jgi:glycerol-3-phosphate responsive antiterminator
METTMLTYKDYIPPSGPHAIVGGGLVQATEGVAHALALNAMLLSVGDPAFVAEQISASENRAAQPA